MPEFEARPARNCSTSRTQMVGSVRWPTAGRALAAHARAGAVTRMGRLAYAGRLSKCALSACVTSVPTMLIYFAFSSEKRA